MKKYILLIVAFSMAVISCQKEEKVVEETREGLTLEAYAEVPTKSTENNGNFLWLEGDQIKVYTTSGSASTFSLTSGAGTPKGSFTTTDAGITVDQVAVSPAIIYSNVDPSTTTATLTLPGYYNYVAGNTNSPMLANVETGNQSVLNFKHVGGVLKVSCTNVPSTARRIILWATNARITGNFDIDYSNLGTNTIESETITSDGQLSIYFTPTSEQMDFYFPLPVGEYSRFTLRMYSNEGGTYKAINGTRLIYAPTGGIAVKRGYLVKTTAAMGTWEEGSDWSGKYMGKNTSGNHVVSFSAPGEYYSVFRFTKSSFETTYNSDPAQAVQNYSNPSSVYSGNVSLVYNDANLGVNDMVFIMAGFTNDAHHNPTGKYKVIEVPATAVTNYEAWIGNWTIAGKDQSNNDLTYNVTVSAAGSYLQFKGWSNSTYYIRAVYNAEDGSISLYNTNVYTTNPDAENPDVEYWYAALGMCSNNMAYVTDDPICNLVLSADKSSATFVPNDSFGSASLATVSIGFYGVRKSDNFVRYVYKRGTTTIQFSTAVMTKS